MLKKLQRCWCFIRQLSGDDAYERYLKQYEQHQSCRCEHDYSLEPLSKKEFFKQWQDEKWQGIKRCC